VVRRVLRVGVEALGGQVGGQDRDGVGDQVDVMRAGGHPGASVSDLLQHRP
jgi:hypothetical protein